MQRFAVATIEPELLSRFRQHLRRLERELADQITAESACDGISIAQCHVLTAIGEQERTTVTALAREMELDKSTLSRTVDALVELGLADRTIDSGNRRSWHLSLTPKGQRRFRTLAERYARFYTHLFRHIPKDRHEQVVDSVRLLMEAVQQTKAGCTCDATSAGCCPTSTVPLAAIRRSTIRNRSDR